MTLETQRLRAAEASRGISSDPSYELARRLLEKHAPPG